MSASAPFPIFRDAAVSGIMSGCTAMSTSVSCPRLTPLYVVLTNDPTPPSTDFVGVHIHSFAIVATGAIVMPGLDLGQDCLIGAGAIVTKSVKPYAVAVGNPARTISDVRDVRNKITGKPVYPWREHFSRYMPWEGMSFEEWYTALPVEEKNRYTLGNLIK